MARNTYAFVLLLVTSVGFALLVYALVSKSLRDLLDNVLKLSAGTTFYLRSLFIGLMSVTLSGAIGTNFNLKSDAQLMEYVWAFANGLSVVLGRYSLLWVAYLLLITMLAISGRKHDQ